MYTFSQIIECVLSTYEVSDRDILLVHLGLQLSSQVIRRQPDLVIKHTLFHLSLEIIFALALQSPVLVPIRYYFPHFPLQHHNTLTGCHFFLEPNGNLDQSRILGIFVSPLQLPLFFFELLELLRLDSSKNSVNKIDVLKNQTVLEIPAAMLSLRTKFEHFLELADHRIDLRPLKVLVFRTSHNSMAALEQDILSTIDNSR